MTIPTLMNNIQDYQFKQAFKEVYSQLNQATIQVLKDKGGISIPYYNELGHLCGLTGQDAVAVNTGNSMDFLGACYYKYLNFTKFCLRTTAVGNCYPASVKSLMGNTYNTPNHSVGMMLKNGVSLLFEYYGPPSNISVDVNGLKPPNVVGRDVYYLRVTDLGITFPSGTCSRTSGGSEACSKNVILGIDY